MLYEEDLSGLFDSVHDTIAKWIAANVYIGGYGRDVAHLKTLSQGLLPVYQKIVMDQGLPAYKVGDGASVPTLKATVSQSRMPEAVVIQYLSSLYDMAKAGLIDLDVWNPALPKPDTLGEKLAKAVGGVTQAAGKGVSSGFNRVLFAAGAVAIIIFLGRAAIDKKL